MKQSKAGLGAIIGMIVLLGVIVVSAAPGSTHEPADAPEALDFAFKDINPKSASFGETIRLSDVYKERGVLLNFVASWCGPCRQELPILESLHSDDAAAVLVVAADENGAGPENVKIVIDRAGATMPVLFAEGDDAIFVAERSKGLEQFTGGSNGSGNEHIPFDRRSHFPGKLHTGNVELFHPSFCLVKFQAMTIAAKRVGQDDIGAGIYK